MTFQVMGDRIAVRPDEKPKQIGSIAVAESVALVPTNGTIVQVGPEVGYYEAGMRVAFPERAGTLIRLDEVDLRVLDPSEVLCLLPSESANA